MRMPFGSPSEEEVTNLETHGDEPPYDRDDVNGADSVGNGIVNGWIVAAGDTSMVDSVRTVNRTQDVLCGLLTITLANTISAGCEVYVHCAAGDYKGVKARAI